MATPYEPELIEEHATELFARAHTARLGWSALGLVAGAAVGAGVLVAPLPLPLPALAGIWALVALAGALAGSRAGARRARELRVRGQMTLCHVHAQYGTLAVWRTLQERLPSAAAAWERVQQPQPLAPAPPPPEPQQLPAPTPLAQLTAEVPPEIAARVAAAVAAASSEPVLPRAAGDV